MTLSSFPAEECHRMRLILDVRLTANTGRHQQLPETCSSDSAASSFCDGISDFLGYSRDLCVDGCMHRGSINAFYPLVLAWMGRSLPMRTPMSSARAPPSTFESRTDSCGHLSPFTVPTGLLSVLSVAMTANRQSLLRCTDPQFNRHQNLAEGNHIAPNMGDVGGRAMWVAGVATFRV